MRSFHYSFLFLFMLFVLSFSFNAYALNRDKICSTFNFTYSECDEFMMYLISNNTIIENHTYIMNETINKTIVLNNTINNTIVRYINNTINKTRVIKIVLNNTITRYINNTAKNTQSQNFYEQLFQTLLLQTIKEKFGLNENDNVDIKELQQQINEIKNSSQQIDYNKISQMIREQLSYVQTEHNKSFDYSTLIMMFIAILFGAFVGYQYFDMKKKKEFEEIKEEYEYPSQGGIGEENRDKNKRRSVI